MIPRAVNSLFQRLREKQQEYQQQNASRSAIPTDNSKASNTMSYAFEVRVQFLELYGEEIRDLLTSTSGAEKLTIRDIGNDEPEVVGATSQVVESTEEALRCLTKGMLRRVTAATAMNEASSRSHAIFSILIDQTWTEKSSTSTTDSTRSNNNKDETPAGPQIRRSKFNFVDLAGSERQKRTQAQGRRLKEGIQINQGLLVLGNVISALGDPKKRGKAFVPYRDSKLTRLLKGSLGGNHKTLMIACVSPASTNMEESLNCLRYANRAKNIQNHAVVNVDARTRMIGELKAQVQALATDLLRVKDTGDTNKSAFTRQVLLTLANGGPGPGSAETTTTAAATAVSPTNSIMSAPASLAQPTAIAGHPFVSPEAFSQSAPGGDDQLQQRLLDTEEELERTRNQLKKSRRESVVVEERLHHTLAEKEFYRLQLEVSDIDSLGVDSMSDAQNKENVIAVDSVFIHRAAQYEKEIERLKDEVRLVRSQLVEQRDPEEMENSFSIEQASQEMEAERQRLSAIQTELLSVSLGPNGSPQKSQSSGSGTFRNTAAGDDRTGVDHVDVEEKAEEEHLTALTLKYSAMDDEDEVMVVNNQDSPRMEKPATDAAVAEAKAAAHRRAQIEADLLEISRIIESKEELISQLQCSQAKYSVRTQEARKPIFVFKV